MIKGRRILTNVSSVGAAVVGVVAGAVEDSVTLVALITSLKVR